MQPLKYFFLIFFFSFLFCSCQNTKQPVAKDGIINISEENFKQPVLLDGEWEFYWNQLLMPHDFNESASRPAPLRVHVPFSWTNYKLENQNLTAYGYGTYHLKISIPASQKEVGLYIPKIWSAAKVWANGSLIYETGKVGKTSAEYQNKIIEELVKIVPQNDEVDLVVQVANFDMFIAGIIQGFRIGKYQTMEEQKELNSSWSLMWIGILVVMSCYHLILYYFRHKNKSTLFFGLITFLIAIRLIVFGEHYLYEYLKHHAGWLTFAIQSKAYYIATFALIPLGLSYAVSLYPDEPVRKLFKLSNNKIIRVSAIITLVYTLFLLVTPPVIFTKTLLIYQAVVGVFMLYLIYILISAMYHKRDESTIQMFGIFTMIFAGINDGLHAQGIELVGQLELMPIAFAIFLSLQFFVIARRFSMAFNEVEDLSANLEKKVKERTKELLEKNEEIEMQKEILHQNSEALQYAYKQITDSVKYAQRIQKAILGTPDEIKNLFSNSFVLFMPKDIVSGDFYFFKQQESRKIIIAADATGHGVPGAFMTVIGSELLHEIIELHPHAMPHEILHQLDDKLFNVLQKQNSNDRKVNDGMDMTILIVDEKNDKAYFSGAKNPIYHIQNNELFQINGDKYPIGGGYQYKKGKAFTTQEISLNKGDYFYMASDGYQDQFGGAGNNKFLKKRFKELLLSIYRMPPDVQKEELESTLRHWKKDQPQTDDVIVLGIEIL